MRSWAICGSLILGIAITGSAAQKPAITVGSATAGPGQKATGAIEVPAASDAGTSIPVVVINGARPGQVLALVSGLHGTEYASIIALEKVIGLLDPKDISGAVIILPLVNVGSFNQKVPHVNPVDRKSMNRFYPGNPNGTQTDRASYMITRDVVDKCDHLIDLHGGDLDESLRPYAYWSKTGNSAIDRTSLEMVLAFGLDHIIISEDRPKDPAASRYLENTATTRGKASIAAEAGYAGTVEPEDVELLANGCLNVMRYLKILPGEYKPIKNPVWVGKVVTVASDSPGIFYPQVKRGTYVEKGMRLGYVSDFYGNRLFEAMAPESGVVLYICAVPSMDKGGTIANIGVISTTPPQ
jgi:predicted deacylase